MDQTISKIVYDGIVNSFVDGINGKNNTSGGSIIASDGTKYVLNGKTLVPVYDKQMIKKIQRIVVPALKDCGVLNRGECSLDSNVTSVVAETVAEL